MYIFYAKSIVYKRGISKLFLTFRKWHQPFKSIGRGKLKNKAWKTKQKDYVFRLKNMHFDVFPFTMILSFLHGDTNCVLLPIHKLSWFEALNRYITHILFFLVRTTFPITPQHLPYYDSQRLYRSLWRNVVNLYSYTDSMLEKNSNKQEKVSWAEKSIIHTFCTRRNRIFHKAIFIKLD